MIKNINKFNKENHKKRIKFLRNLSITHAAKILEQLLSSKLLNLFIYKREDHPLSLEKALRYAKFSG